MTELNKMTKAELIEMINSVEGPKIPKSTKMKKSELVEEAEARLTVAHTNEEVCEDCGCYGDGCECFEYDNCDDTCERPEDDCGDECKSSGFKAFCSPCTVSKVVVITVIGLVILSSVFGIQLW